MGKSGGGKTCASYNRVSTASVRNGKRLVGGEALLTKVYTFVILYI